eukprot:786023-Rhodomonas_salina.4
MSGTKISGIRLCSVTHAGTEWVCAAMPGTERAYGPTREESYRVWIATEEESAEVKRAIGLRVCYALSGTDVAYDSDPTSGAC